MLQFRIIGMDCMEEVSSLRRELLPLVGSDDRISFDLLQARMTINQGGTSVTSEMVIEAVAKTGMRAEPWTDAQHSSVAAASNAWRRSTTWTTASGILVALGVLVRAISALDLGSSASFTFLSSILLVAAVITGLRLVAPKAFHAARRLRPDMNLLMMIAVCGAVLIGELVEGASVIFLFGVAEMLETWSVRRAHRAISSLLDLTPRSARVLMESGKEINLPVDEIKVGSRILVKPGERIPFDGRVVGGSSTVDQSPITGESIPAEKGVSDNVFAGTVNGNGVLEVQTVTTANDTTLSHIVRLVESAQRQRSTAEKWVEQFALYYTPSVLCMSLLLAIGPPLLGGASWSEWFYRSLVLLVIACPCALVISTPVSIVAALTSAARHGVLIKGGVFVEIPARVKAIAFDKTGTITTGKPTVRSIIPLNGHSANELLDRAAALETRSNHPLAHAVVAHAEAVGITVKAADDCEMLPGKGAIGRWQGTPYWLGSVRMVAERRQLSSEVRDMIHALANNGETVLAVGNDQHVCGLIGLADTVRPTAAQAIAELKSVGVTHTVMLTGDSSAVSTAIGKEVGIDEIHAELLPTEKVVAVERLVDQYASVAMVGDGINDAPALARASIGIAMGVAGSDVAVETADITLMSNDLNKLPWLFRLSRRTRMIIQQNIWFSLLVKLTFVVLTFLGYSTLWGAIVADMGASFIVIANGLRLLERQG